jgi:hypothetical protein
MLAKFTGNSPVCVAIGICRLSILQANADCLVLATNRNQQAVKSAFLRKRTITLCLRAVTAGEN